MDGEAEQTWGQIQVASCGIWNRCFQTQAERAYMYITVHNALGMALGSLGLLTCALLWTCTPRFPCVSERFWAVRARTLSSGGYLVKI